MDAIGGVCFERSGILDAKMKFKQVGKLYWDTDQHRASLLLHAWHQGTLFANAYKGLKYEAPYLSGDILASTGKYKDEKTGRMKNKWMWCGHIQSVDNEVGNAQYIIQMESIPLLVLARFAVDATKKDDTESIGMWLSIFLVDDNKPAPTVTEPVASDDLPF